MKNENQIIVVLILLTLLSCHSNTSKKKKSFSLNESDKVLTFSLNSHTKSSINVMSLFTDSTGKEYLTFQNPGQNGILFYDMHTQELAFEVEPEVDGSNGVGFYMGYYIQSLDSIFLTSSDGISKITLIDHKARIINQYPHDKTQDSISLQDYHAISFVYKPIININNKLYIMPSCNRWTDKDPVCAYIDLSDHTVHALLGFEYPSFPGADNKAKFSGVENDVSRCYDGKRFVYAFYYDEDIYVVSPDHKSIQRVKVKSKYIDKVKQLNDYMLTEKEMCENPNYGNLIYDKYRNVYYRIAYPEIEIEKNVRPLELLMYGRKKFSIIILDQDFNTIGETLFPEYIYNSAVMFIREDGLYISTSHPMNPDYSDDKLTFKCLTLENTEL
ncbi:MAG: DUF4221 domain-containing protein [Porphyromonadaceae bacterium]|nr:DUF4221 domain-containing protein [Porphyromonadaceae bacterium]